MKYILSHNVALRSWWFIPYAYYMRGCYGAKKLSADEFDILKKCDGITSVEPSDLLDSLIERGLCLPAEEGGASDRLAAIPVL